MITLTGSGSSSRAVSTSMAQAASRPDDLSTNAHRQLIGYIGLVLPFLLILVAVARDGVERWRGLDSISAYYYTGGVAAFVGMLVALALFLFTYRGYDNKYNWWDRWTARTAAGASLVVAFFPTRAPEGVPALPWWTPTTGVLHHGAAIVLFAMFATFALWLFRRTAEGERPGPEKRARNTLYLSCGVAIIVCMLWAAFSGWRGRPIFWPESIALIAFALSWLVKGYAHRTIASATRSWLHR